MDIQRKIDIMGIVNLTDDSYFADSRCLSSSTLDKTSENAVARAWKLIREGATIIDIGACSTRPGSEPVGEQVEWKRIAPSLSALLLACPGVRISIDTWWASVIEKAFAATAALIGEDKARDTLIVNDISAGEDDPSMLPLVGEIGLEYIAMHKRGNSKTMQSLCDYGNVTEEVLRYFEAFGQKASRYGIRKWVLDPGFGFAKTVDQNYQLLDEKQENTPVQQWLMAHCTEYGFILRYPTGKSKITGIGYEPWHYRYVGSDAAREITDQGLCLEEYLDSTGTIT